MDNDRLDHFRKLLSSRLDDLLSGAEKTVSGMIDENEDNFPDPTDRASHETDRNFLLRVKDRERKLVGKVKEALARIDDGSYGICEICGEDIQDKRLEVRPVTTCCIECKKEAEEMEKNRVSAGKGM